MMMGALHNELSRTEITPLEATLVKSETAHKFRTERQPHPYKAAGKEWWRLPCHCAHGAQPYVIATARARAVTQRCFCPWRDAQTLPVRTTFCCGEQCSSKAPQKAGAECTRADTKWPAKRGQRMSISGASGRTGWGRRRAPRGGSTQGQSTTVFDSRARLRGTREWPVASSCRSAERTRGAYQPADRRHTAAHTHTPLLRTAVLLVCSLGNCLVEDVCGRYPPRQSKHRLSKWAHFTAFSVGTVRNARSS